MMKKNFLRVIPAAISLLLIACSGSESHLRILQSANALQVESAQSPDFDYTVSLRNVKDFGYDIDDKSMRYAIALHALQTQCPNGKIVGETVINTGTYALGDPSRTYVVRVRCK